MFGGKSAPAPLDLWGSDEGRVITFGYSQIQKVAGGATINLWRPRDLPEQYRKADKLEWAAIRQVEILQEGSHIELWDLNAHELWESFKYFRVGRARGCRLAIVVAGVYKKPVNEDHLSSFDKELRERLQNMAGMLWLDELGKLYTQELKEHLEKSSWNVTKSLPHVGTALNAIQVFRRDNPKFSGQLSQSRDAINFFTQLEGLSMEEGPKHDVMVGLKLPQHQADNDIDWGPTAEFSRMPFNSALKSIFNTFGLDCGQIHHLRGYGDHMNSKKENFYAPAHG